VVLDFAGKTRNRFLIAKLVGFVRAAGAAGRETPSEWLKGVRRSALGSDKHGIAAEMFPVFVSCVEMRSGRERSRDLKHACGGMSVKRERSDQ